MNSTRPAFAGAIIAALAAAGAAAAAPVPAAVFGFTIVDTSISAGSAYAAADQARLPKLDAQLRDLLRGEGLAATDISAVADAARHSVFRTCDGCDVPLADKVGAKVSVIGWVQKVSQLILNINLVIRSVPDGRVLHAGSVDIRGDTDESFSRGLTYLIKDRLFP